MAELSCPWKRAGLAENLQHIHPVQTSNVEKIITEIEAKTDLSDLFLYYFEPMKQCFKGDFFFKGSKCVICKMQISAASKHFYKDCKVV